MYCKKNCLVEKGSKRPSYFLLILTDICYIYLSHSSRVFLNSEGMAKKGANEVCIFLQDFINDYVLETAKTLRFMPWTE
jgi:hypothetical protein